MQLPIIADFTSSGGLTVKVHAASLADVFAIVEAGTDNLAVMRATYSLVEHCAEIEGIAPDVSPTSVLSIADCQQVVKLAQRVDGSSDFS